MIDDKRISPLLTDAFDDVASRIADVLTKEFNRRRESDVPPAYFNCGYSYCDFLGKILSNEQGALSEEDVRLADKIIDREFKKFTSAELLAVRLYAMENGSEWHGSMKEARMHVLGRWKRELLMAYMNNDNYEFPVTFVRQKPDVCPYCGSKLEDFGCDGPGYPEWRCVGCGSEFRKE